jgi:hypothetical protein
MDQIDQFQKEKMCELSDKLQAVLDGNPLQFVITVLMGNLINVCLQNEISKEDFINDCTMAFESYQKLHVKE